MKKSCATAESRACGAWLEARVPGTVKAMQAAFEDLLCKGSPRSLDPDEIKALASLIVMESSWGGNLEEQLIKHGRKAAELLPFVPPDARYAESARMLCAWVIRAWEVAKTEDEQYEFSIQLLNVPIYLSSAVEVELREALVSFKDAARVQQVLACAMLGHNEATVSFMIRHLVKLARDSRNWSLLTAYAEAMASVSKDA